LDPATGAVLDLDGVEKSFPAPSGQRRVLTGVDMRVGPGEIVALTGRSGSGKTTLLTIVAGWEQPDAGSVTLFGDPAAVPLGEAHAWRQLAILPQSLGLLDELTVGENITLPLRLDHVDPAADPSADPSSLMERLGIDHLADRFPSEVSLGEQQRAALARAAVVRPALLLADEPIAHQNRTWAEGMMLLFGELASRGTTCLLATHNEVAFDTADRVLELREGALHPLGLHSGFEPGGPP
jgi:ABC-type lipoprotein export system ATPase subunit